MELNNFEEIEQPELPLKVKLEIFEGPLDLLLHLIKKNEIDIYDIPITMITQQYLEYLDVMKSLNLDIAGEFLLMAATLLHIKSKMLLPPSEDELAEENPEAEEDPRAELVRRLLEYQRFKEAALEMNRSDLLDREVFTRTFYQEDFLKEAEEAVVGDAALFDLLEALKKVLEALPPEEFQEISLDHLSLKDKINAVMEALWEKETLAFQELFTPATPRREVIIT
ncbi:MAG: segregation/condensation protein A, partial [Deltaproteobacteria bacterium]